MNGPVTRHRSSMPLRLSIGCSFEEPQHQRASPLGRSPVKMTLPLMLVVVLTTLGCAIAQPALIPRPPVRLDELMTLTSQGLSDDAVIAEIEKRGVVFILSAQDLATQRAAGVSDGVLRYLQGRASGEQELKASLLRARYRLPDYGGTLYLGYRYLGYLDGAHCYGDLPGYGSFRYHGGRYSNGHHAGDAAHHGGHRSGHH